MASSKKKNRKPRVGDWFTLDGPWGWLDFKVSAIERGMVAAKGIDILIDPKRVVNAEWVGDEDAAKLEIEIEELRARHSLRMYLEKREMEDGMRYTEIQELVGVETVKPYKGKLTKKYGDLVQWKPRAELHAEIIAAIKKLKAKK